MIVQNEKYIEAFLKLLKTNNDLMNLTIEPNYIIKDSFIDEDGVTNITSIDLKSFSWCKNEIL